MFPSIDSKEWSQLLERAHAEAKYIGKNSTGQYILCDKVAKITLSVIEGQSRIFQKEFSPEAQKIAMRLKTMAEQSNLKHYMGFKKIIKIFVIFYNGLTGRGFETLENKIAQLAHRMERTNQYLNFFHQEPSFTSQSSSTDSKKHPSITKYDKSDHSTLNLVPTIKDKAKGIVGIGASGKVCLHRDDERLVVKKSFRDLTEEFSLGSQLSHPCIVETRQLFIKTYGKSKERVCKLVMRKIEGTVINFYPSILPDQVAKTMLLEVKYTMTYLFLNQVFWGDASCNNVFITKDNHFKICDLGLWGEEKTTVKLAKKLLVGAMQIAYSIIGKTDLGSDKDCHLKDKICKPEQFFLVSPSSEPISSINTEFYDSTPWMKIVTKRLHKSSQEGCIEFLETYIDHVIENFLNRTKI